MCSCPLFISKLTSFLLSSPFWLHWCPEETWQWGLCIALWASKQLQRSNVCFLQVFKGRVIRGLLDCSSFVFAIFPSPKHSGDPWSSSYPLLFLSAHGTTWITPHVTLIVTQWGDPENMSSHSGDLIYWALFFFFFFFCNPKSPLFSNSIFECTIGWIKKSMCSPCSMT